MNGEGAHQNTSIPELLSRARHLYESGLSSWRAATEDIAAAKARGATQRQIADAVGMSSTWVHQMLKWRTDGYKDATPFGRQSRASRQRAKASQATDQKKQKAEKSDTGADQAQAAAASARAKTAKAEAAKAKADAEKVTAEALRAKAEALKARAEAAKAEADARSARARSNNPNRQKVHSGPRDLLVKALGMLGSDHVGERAAAALVVERLRAKLGMTWDDLVIPADEAEACRREATTHPRTFN
jgi:hypothetical protein